MKIFPFRRNQLGLLLALLLCLGVVPPAAAQQAQPQPTPRSTPRATPLPTLQPTPQATLSPAPQVLPLPDQEPRTLDELRPPKLLAKAAVVLDADTGRLLYAKLPHQQLAVASLTKMVTAMVALEQGRLDQPIEATQLSYTVPSVIGLDAGDVLTLEQMLYGLMMKSGNDAALAIAEALGGGTGQASIDRFVELMNQKVQRLGLRNTHFVNPNGLEAEGHYSSAYDMAQIARAYMQVPILAQIAATQHYEINIPPGWIFQNINGFLYSFPGADGVKTGYEDLAGKCLAASAVRSGHRLITVILNSDEYVSDGVRLMHYGFSNYAWLALNAEANPLLDQSGPSGDSVPIVPASQPELLFAPSQLGYLQTLVQVRTLEERVSRTAQPLAFPSSRGPLAPTSS